MFPGADVPGGGGMFRGAMFRGADVPGGRFSGTI